MGTDGLVIRRAVVEDAAYLASVHVRAWQWTYRGQLPDDYLDRLDQTLERRERFRREMLSSSGHAVHLSVAEIAGHVVGFVDVGACRDADAEPDWGELWSIHVDPNFARRGIGRALQAAGLDDLREQGFRLATLWVLETNERARKFYEATGWHVEGATKIEPRDGFDLHEVRYITEL